MPLRLAIPTISDAGSRGERSERGFVPDETVRIARTLSDWTDGDRADLILTTGGTGAHRAGCHPRSHPRHPP